MIDTVVFDMDGVLIESEDIWDAVREAYVRGRGGRYDAEVQRAIAPVEDSHSGIRSAKSAGMRVVAIPNASYPPDADALAQADVVIRSLDELTPELIAFG